MTRSGSRVRKDCVGFPGSFLSVTLGSSLELTHRLNDVYTPAAFTRSELGTPGRGVKGRGEVDVVHQPALLEVRLAPGNKQGTCGQVGLGAMQKHPCRIDLERHWFAHGT